jgi:hypothetical protein
MGRDSEKYEKAIISAQLPIAHEVGGISTGFAAGIPEIGCVSASP